MKINAQTPRLDTLRLIETPEGVELTLRVAGPAVRATAWLIDLMLRFAIYYALGHLLSNLGELGTGLLLISIFLMEWLYPVLFEVYWYGMTPGKRAMRLRVVHDSGIPVGWSGSMIRNLLRAVDFMPIFYGFGLLSMMLNQDFKRLGDIAADTVVIYQDSVLAHQNLPDVPPQSSQVALLPAEQEAIISFAVRSEVLSDARQLELADIVQSLTGTQKQASVQTLHQIANSLTGHQHSSTISGD